MDDGLKVMDGVKVKTKGVSCENKGGGEGKREKTKDDLDKQRLGWKGREKWREKIMKSMIRNNGQEGY